MYSQQMTGETILMDGSKCLYHIPDYQREYAWGTKDAANRAGGPEVSEFWQDIYERCWVLGKSHFIGTILCSRSTLNGQPCFDIVDGQQRITTLFVLCIALRDFLEENNLANPKLTERLSDNQKEPRLVLSDRQGHDRDTLANLLLSRHEIIASTESKDNKMMAAYRGLKHEIFQKFSNQPIKAQEFLNTIFLRVTLLFVILEQSDDASTIFGTLNDRGRQVDDLEKLRNIITFSVPQDKQLSAFAVKVWNSIDSTLDDREQRLFADALGERHGFRTIRRRAQDEIRAAISQALANNSFATWLADTQKCLEIFSILLNSPGEQGNASGLVRLEVESLNPLILGIIERAGFESEVLLALENVAMRLITYYERPTASLFQLNLKSCDILGTNPTDWAQKLVKYWREDYEVSNQDFTEQLRTKRLYGPGVTRRRLLYLLERIENSQHKLGKFSFTKNCTIEHIIPQTLSAEWLEELAEAQPKLTKQQILSLHEANLHTLGNLTVLVGTDQPLTSNYRFEKKVEIYRDLEGGKPTFLNSYFDKHKSWGLNKVETRGKQLADIAKDLWPKL
jgi:hypothetical protein